MSKIPPASIYIRPMEESDIQALLLWNKNTSESFLHQWSGFSAYQYPLTAEQIRARLALPSCRLIAAVFQGETVAAAEIDGTEASEPLEPSQEAAISSASSSAHVCRLIVSRAYNSMGIGEVFLTEISRRCFSETSLSRLTLRVFCFNAGAIRCYEKCGFLVKEYHPGHAASWPCYTMELTKERFLQLFTE